MLPLPNGRRGSRATARAAKTRLECDDAILLPVIGVVLLGAAFAFTFAVVVLTRHDGRTLGYALLLVSCFMLPWNAVTFGPVPIADLPLLAAAAILALFALVSPGVRLPKPLVIGVALLIVAGLLSALLPPSTHYLYTRTSLQSLSTFNPLDKAARNSSDLVNLSKYLVAILLIPVLAVVATHHRASRVRGLAYAWVAGIGVSAATAFADHRGITHISSGLIGYTDVTGRQPGLSEQPNHLGVQLVIAMPIALFMFNRGRAARAAAVTYLVLAGLGLYVAASRGDTRCCTSRCTSVDSHTAWCAPSRCHGLVRCLCRDNRLRLHGRKCGTPSKAATVRV